MSACADVLLMSALESAMTIPAPATSCGCRFGLLPDGTTPAGEILARTRYNYLAHAAVRSEDGTWRDVPEHLLVFAVPQPECPHFGRLEDADPLVAARWVASRMSLMVEHFGPDSDSWPDMIVYSLYGAGAGRSIEDHYHEHIFIVPQGTPASGKGAALLFEWLNTLYDVNELVIALLEAGDTDQALTLLRYYQAALKSGPVRPPAPLS